MGEQAVLSLNRDALVLRVAHLFGGTTSDVKRANLVQRFLTAAERGETIRVSDKQTLNPTSVVDIVETTMRLLKANAAGLYHTTGAGSCTAAEFARAVFEFAGVKADIVNATDSRPARRPAYSALDNARLRAEGYPELPHWREALARYVKRLRR
jgi:dTDP-4-dehydrorhamnose reductase